MMNTDSATTTPAPADPMAKAEAIRALNDEFRTRLSGGSVMITAGIIALGLQRQLEIIEAVRAFDEFDTGNDPYHEHDFGALDHRGETVFSKIDYYDPALEKGSDDPTDPTRTRRVLTIMLANEW
jgi:hypothetical protein